MSLTTTRETNVPGTAYTGVSSDVGSAVSSIMEIEIETLSFIWPFAARVIGPESERTLVHSSEGLLRAPFSMSCLTGVETTEIVASDVPMFLTLKSKVAVVELNTSNNLEEASPCSSGGTSFPIGIERNDD